MKKSFAFVFVIFLASVSLLVPVAHATTCDPEDTSSTNGGCAATEYCDANNGTPVCKAQSSFSATAPNAAAGTLPTATPAATTAAAPTPTAATPAAATPVTTSNVTNKFVTLTQIPQIKQIAQTSNLAGLFNVLYEIAIGAGSAVALLEIIYAGITWMTAGDSTEKVRSAKNRIRNTLLGLVLLLSPTVVFSIINPNILNFNVFTTDLNGIAVQSASPASGAAVGTPATSAGTGACAYSAQYIIVGQCKSGDTSIPTTCCNQTSIADGSVCCGSNPVTTTPSSTGASGLNVQAAVSFIQSNAKPLNQYTGLCGVAVRNALAAGGLSKFSVGQGNAYQMGAALAASNFSVVYQGTYGANSDTAFAYQPGDITVFQPVNSHPNGHITMYIGSNVWVSDAIQAHMASNYSDYQGGSFTVYRP